MAENHAKISQSIQKTSKKLFYLSMFIDKNHVFYVSLILFFDCSWKVYNKC